MHLEAVNSSDNKALIQLLFASCSPGYGSIASPAKEEKIASNKDDSPTKESPPSESTQEMVDGRKMFESWLFDKLTFITAMELQVKRCSISKVYDNVYFLISIWLVVCFCGFTMFIFTLAGSNVETLTFTHKLIRKQINFGSLLNAE